MKKVGECHIDGKHGIDPRDEAGDVLLNDIDDIHKELLLGR